MRTVLSGSLFLDSNEAQLGAKLWAEQAAWLVERLAAFDADPAIAGVVVFVHHPPFTNSTVTGDELHVRQAFVPPFAAARKTLAMVAGHVHSYEHFVRGAKTFLVAGGGGGPRVRLARGAARRHADDLFDGPELRHFHFLAADARHLRARGRGRRAREGSARLRARSHGSPSRGRPTGLFPPQVPHDEDEGDRRDAEELEARRDRARRRSCPMPKSAV